MRVIRGDPWAGRTWRVITTNLSVRKDGQTVMGRGTALEAAQRYARLQREYGRRLEHGNGFEVSKDYNLIGLPTKRVWQEPADPELIETELRKPAPFRGPGKRHPVPCRRPQGRYGTHVRVAG